MSSFRGVKSRRMVLLIATCLFFMFMVGCGSHKFNSTTLEFVKNGSVRLHIVEPFDTSIYSYEELCSMNENEVNTYNQANTNKSVKILGSEEADGLVRIDMEYSNASAYYDLNKKVLFYGTVAKAKSAGYNLTGKVMGVMGEGSLEPAQWKDMDGQKVIIISELIDVQLPGKILYAGEGVTMTGTNKATVDTEGLHYIICE